MSGVWTMSEQKDKMSEDSATHTPMHEEYSQMEKGAVVKMVIPPGAKFCPHCGKPLKEKKDA